MELPFPTVRVTSWRNLVWCLGVGCATVIIMGAQNTSDGAKARNPDHWLQPGTAVRVASSGSHGKVKGWANAPGELGSGIIGYEVELDDGSVQIFATWDVTEA